MQRVKRDGLFFTDSVVILALIQLISAWVSSFGGN